MAEEIVSIGFVGVGIMGKGMLKNLATKMPGNLVIWNRQVIDRRS
jgi:3-hydroxyisobutyrate dehydrogenase-like beta-hydroxyacid dehydrogenase